MTTEAKTEIKNSLTTWITFGNMVLLLGLFYSRGQTDESMNKNIEANQKAIISIERDINLHKASTYEHRSMDDLMIKFIPREELNTTLQNIIKSQDEIKQLIKENSKKN